MSITAVAAMSQQFSPRLDQEMRWRMIGPFRGGRTLAAAGIPGQPDVYYFGAVGGAVWRTTNGGVTWSPIFDQQPVASIGALAIAPSDPNIIYAGSGEPDMRSDISFGNGMYKSTDSGQTWRHIGLDDTRQIARISVDPQDPNQVLVAALGHAYGANAERGVFRSVDGGEHWQKVLYKDENTGAADVVRDPDDPQVVYASLWRARRTTWSTYAPINGGGAIYTSSDGGATWHPLTGTGLPAGDWGRVGLAIGKGNGIKRIYASIDVKDGGLFRSDDGGKTWEHVGTDPRVRSRLWYFSGITVDPQNPDVVYVANVSLYRSTDGGKTFTAIKGAPGGDDYHYLWIDPKNPQRMIVASDQGATISVDGGRSWSSWMNQPTAQFYHVSTDNQFPYHVYGAQQDSGTVETTSRGDSGSITFRDWHPVGAGEGGYIVPDPTDSHVVYGGETNGALFRYDDRSGQSQDISPAVDRAWGVEISQRKLRFTWTSPLVFSPQNPHVLYFGSQYLLRTTDRGMSWQVASPDLTGATGEKCPDTKDVDLATARRCGYGVIYTIAPSGLVAGQIWIGTDTGFVQLTRDDGKTWTNVTPTGLSDWSKISMIEASHFDPASAYVAVDRHRLDDYRPHVFRTHDFGKTWQAISNGIEQNSYVHAVREDPVRKGLLYAGTEKGVYVSLDDGDHWQALQLNMAMAPIHDLVVKDNDLVVATHGRSFWILDDLSPLRQINSETAASAAHLFKPAATIRVRRNVNHDTPLTPETPAGQNPPPGAIIDYYLGADQQGEVKIDILAGDGSVVHSYSSNDRQEPLSIPPPFPMYWLRASSPLAKSAGMHRLVWNMRYPAPKSIVHEYTADAIPGRDTPARPQGPQAAPGEYRVRLTVAGQSYEQPLKLVEDPRVQAPAADLVQQSQLELQIAAAIDQAYGALQEAQALQAELKNLGTSTGQAAKSQQLRSAVAALAQKLDLLAGSEDANDPTKRDLRSSIRDLSQELGVIDSADAAPTRQAREGFQRSQQLLQSQMQEWSSIKTKDLPALNELLKRNGLKELARTTPRDLGWAEEE